MSTIGRSRSGRGSSGIRPTGVYTTGDFGPLVRKFEETPVRTRSDGRLEWDVEESGGFSADAGAVAARAEMDEFAVKEHIRGHMANFGTETPATEADRPRDGANPASNLRVRRQFGWGHEGPDHSEMNFSHMGPDPRGTIAEPDRSKMVEMTWARSGYLEKTLRGHDSAAQEIGDSPFTDRDERAGRYLATEILRRNKKVFTTSRGNLARGAHVPTGVMNVHDATRYQDVQEGGAGGNGREMVDSMIRPANNTTIRGYEFTPAGILGGVTDHYFDVASYALHAPAAVPQLESVALVGKVLGDNEFEQAREVRNKKAMQVGAALAAVAQTASDSDTFLSARAAMVAAAPLPQQHAHGMRTTRNQADFSSSHHSRVHAATPWLAGSSGGDAARLGQDEAGMSEQAHAKLAAAEAFAKVASNPIPTKDATNLGHQIGEMARGEVMIAEMAEKITRRGKAAARASASAVAGRQHQARHHTRFGGEYHSANYSSAPSLAQDGIAPVSKYAGEAVHSRAKLSVERKSKAHSGSKLGQGFVNAQVVDGAPKRDGAENRVGRSPHGKSSRRDRLASTRAAYTETMRDE